MNDRDVRMECVRLAVSVRHLIPLDVRTVEIAQAYYEFVVASPGPLNQQGLAGGNLRVA